MSISAGVHMPSLSGATGWLNSQRTTSTGSGAHDRTLEITFDGPGAEAYSFTFGSFAGPSPGYRSGAMLLRLRVHVRHRRLDALLADGRTPVMDAELELRAAQLARPARRATLARALRRAMRSVDERPRRRWVGSQVPVAAASIRQCMPELRDLARALTDIRAGVQGVAIASLLVTDGSSPLYMNAGPERLRDAVLAAYLAL